MRGAVVQFEAYLCAAVGLQVGRQDGDDVEVALVAVCGEEKQARLLRDEVQDVHHLLAGLTRAHKRPSSPLGLVLLAPGQLHPFPYYSFYLYQGSAQ